MSSCIVYACVLFTYSLIRSTHQPPGCSFHFLYFISDFSEKEALYICAVECYGKRQYCEIALELEIYLFL